MTARAPAPHERRGGSALRLLLLDNYDSFTWNLAHAFEAQGACVDVVLNDRLDVEGVPGGPWSGVVISPGPGRPEQAGATMALVRRVAGRLPLLGVCLGHQAIALAWGGRIVPAVRLMHGKTSTVRHDGRGVFRGCPDPLVATRYHSLAVDPARIPAELEVTARAEDGTVMGLRHRRLPVEGVQFHPESVLTAAGPALLAGFLRQAGRWRRPVDDAA